MLGIDFPDLSQHQKRPVLLRPLPPLARPEVCKNSCGFPRSASLQELLLKFHFYIILQTCLTIAIRSQISDPDLYKTVRHPESQIQPKSWRVPVYYFPDILAK